MTPFSVPFSQLDEQERYKLLNILDDVRPDQAVAHEWAWNHMLRFLNSEEQTLAYWYYVQNETMVQIAARMELSESAVHWIHGRLIDKLRKEFKSRV